MAPPVVETPLSWATVGDRSHRWVVMLALAIGLLYGALGCAAGLASGAGHLAHVGDSGASAGHEHHAASGDDTVLGDEPAHDGSTTVGATHPGMACVVAVALFVPAPRTAWFADRTAAPVAALAPTCPADVEPPVPRLS